MYGYRDMTFCNQTSCALFKHCRRALTNEVRQAAEEANAPIAQYVDKPDCYEVQKNEDSSN